MRAVNINQIASIKLALTLVVAVSLQSSLTLSAFAQAADESFLPPEVTPVSAAAANKLMQAQSQAMPVASDSATPGLVSSQGGMNNFSNQFGGQNAGQIKKNFYNSLMGQGNYPQFEGNNGPISSKFGTPGGNTFSNQGAGPSGPVGGPMQGPSGQQSMNQSNWNAPPQSASNSAPMQSQTLSGSVANQQQSQSKRQGAGFSHGLSALTGFGASAFAMGLMSRSNPAALYGVGLQGAALGNYGMRNGFQF